MLYRRWILANGWSELVGLGGTFLLGYFLAASVFDSTSIAATILGALTAILLGTLLEGVLVGYAQGRVLHAHRADIAVRAWVVATAVGAGAAWTLGMVPSTVMALLTADAPAATSPPPNPEGIVQYALAAALGAALGPFLGVPQALVLRRHVPLPWRWVLANTLAWAIGMPLIFAGMDWIGATPGPFRLVGGVAITCLTAGLVVGAIHGRWVRALLTETGGRPAVDAPSMSPGG